MGQSDRDPRHARAVVVGCVILLLSLLAALPARAVEVERVISPGGIEAWLVQDHKNPIVALNFSFEGGAALDPEGKAGVANLLSTLLDEGAGELDSQTFQRQLEDNAIRLGFGAGRDAFTGSLVTLSENQDEAYRLLRLALSEPRFDDEAIERMRNSVLAGIRRDLGNPDYIAQVTFSQTVFPDHPYGRPVRGSLETVPHITRDDLRGFVKERFAKDTLLVAAAGDITPDELGLALDRVFGALPSTATPFTIPEVVPKTEGQVLVASRPTAQSVLLLGQPGLKRKDPDWFPAAILNYVLGGGTFTSRLMEEVRVKRGLSYGVSSSLQPLDHSALLMAGGSTVNVKAAETLAVIKDVWAGIARDGITAEELADAKTYLTGSFPLQFSSTASISGVLLQVRRDDLGIDYLKRRSDLINAVTLDDVNRVARTLLDPVRLTTVVVGQPDGIQASKTPGEQGG
ncbi:MAG TPA: pitrilysin family protein [Azospirillaceae bacterium]|nr:pitrilysin family protein [Azospirillaceae bacterium]